MSKEIRPDTSRIATMIGPGKYDAECTFVREWTKATAAIVVVVNGNKGSGFSCQAPPEIAAKLPAILRDMADQIERSNN
jgi:hypothetical protein